MKKIFKKSLFLFRRDLRLEDNTGLIFALHHSETVIPAFIFTPEQIEHNPYRSEHCLKFMLESLKDLEEQLKQKGGKLYLFRGKPKEIVDQCIRNLHIDALIVNRDYTPYSTKRDEALAQLCKNHDLPFHSFDDVLLHPPEETLKKDGKPYAIFTPYFRNAAAKTVLLPVANRGKNYFHGDIPFAEGISLKPDIKNSLPGGRGEGLKILNRLGEFAAYETRRNFPADEEGSTHLSPYLKFNVCSPREVYAAISHHLHLHHALIRSLYWRDFFSSIAFFFPHVFQGAFHPKFDQLKWSEDHHVFSRWCEGTTGFPIVDAGMREMNQTGFMHNRVRMIAASFLVKDLQIDWRWGEKYFAQTLVDYDPAVNNGNWQWVASTGCDAQPYFRIFNPWNQQKKFDPDGFYIKKWIPELKNLAPKILHQWYQEKYHSESPTYPVPMVNHEEAIKETLKNYRKGASKR
ncbi:MAG: deoxyribodipyrimidine photo-lyase [Verrucomicrobia bacterium]|nr:deoxyribodipyrimidine photo-lyase [Verrucomicrobiota bacterium]